MTIRTLLIAGIAITSGIPASAQDITAPATNGAAASHSEGIRIAEVRGDNYDGRLSGDYDGR